MELRKDLLKMLEKEGFSLSSERLEQVILFYDLLQKENQVQNLTRLSSPQEFCQYHVKDCLELLKEEGLEFPALDLGSGGGVPGLLSALIGGQNWVLAESEGRKAQFLSRCVDTLGLSDQVQVVSDRAETYLKSHALGSVVARAVGKVEKIYGWIRKCSTWNTLVLLKGPGWHQEWLEFQESRFSGELRVENERDYEIALENKQRKIILLKRVLKS
ncbi:MAG: 16S rRNA (guanine(527)-N(7))-methyltransferase RsmG [Bdellovibrionia bacterium]